MTQTTLSSFFGPPKNKEKRKVSRIQDDSDDELPHKPHSRPQDPGLKKRKQVIHSDSEDEPLQPKKKGGPTVDPTTFFGNTAVQQSQKILSKKKPPAKSPEISIHPSIFEDLDDDDFDNFSSQPKASPTKPNLETKPVKLPQVPPSSARTSPSKPNVETSKPAAPKPQAKTPQPATSVPKPQAKTPQPATSTTSAAPPPKKSGYAQYMAKKNAQGGPSALGSKPIPVGSENCLVGKTFVFTGEMSSITRDSASDLVRRYGARVTTAPSKKTTYLVVGDEPGEKKVEKAKGLGVAVINEDELFDLIRNSAPQPEPPTKPEKNPTAKKSTSAKSSPVDKKKVAPVVEKKSVAPQATFSVPEEEESSLWTVKYKPRAYADIIGNKTMIEKLAGWLKNWAKSRAAGFPKGGKDDLGNYRAVLISGPPGIGKTTAAHLVCELEGWEAIEFNASDTRSKKALQGMVQVLTGTHTISEFYSADAKGKGKHVQANTSKKQVIIMDEVDGMSAGDRGGSAELINLIKKTKVPIICICNDRQSPKIRSLVNHCYDMKFRRPMDSQVESRLKSIAQKEGLELKVNVVHELVQGTQGDFRQILNLLSTYRLREKVLTFDGSKELLKISDKNVTMSPWDSISKLLGQSSFRQNSVTEKLDFFFNDFSLMPLFMQENYIKNQPAMAAEVSGGNPTRMALETMDLISKAADSISDGDMVGKSMGMTNWSLLPAFGVLSTVRPAFFVHGSSSSQGGYGGMYQFPGWLGQNSKATKFQRILREVQSKMRIKISGDKSEVRQNYLPTILRRLSLPLAEFGKEAVPDIIKLMDEYYLTKEDYDDILDMGIGNCSKDFLLKDVASTVKSNLTATYNKSSHPIAFHTVKASSFKASADAKVKPDVEDVLDEDEEIEEVEEKSDDDIDEFKKKSKKGSAVSKAKASGSKTTKKPLSTKTAAKKVTKKK